MCLDKNKTNKLINKTLKNFFVLFSLMLRSNGQSFEGNAYTENALKPRSDLSKLKANELKIKQKRFLTKLFNMDQIKSSQSFEKMCHY